MRLSPFGIQQRIALLKLFSKRLRLLRVNMGYDVAQFAKIVRVHKRSICYYENGDQLPGPVILAKIANVLNVKANHSLEEYN